MINSAKVDGEISQDEQQTILGQVGDTSQETIQFLRAEFARPLNVDEFYRIDTTRTRAKGLRSLLDGHQIG